MARAKRAPYHGRWVMRVGARLRAGYVAAGVLAIGAGAAQAVAAQDGGRVARWVGHAPLASPAVSQVGPARGILRTLVGSWRFEIRFAGDRKSTRLNSSHMSIS